MWQEKAYFRIKNNCSCNNNNRLHFYRYMLEQILNAYNLTPSEYEVAGHGAGLINHTYTVTGKDKTYILQQINVNVFKTPEDIAGNLSLISKYLKVTQPDYLFVVPIPATDGRLMVKSETGELYRLFPFITGSKTITTITDIKAAYEAAKQFGLLTRLLKDFDPAPLKYTLPDFHNLKLRYEQFEQAEASASKERKEAAATEIAEIYAHKDILKTYLQLIENKTLSLRVIHHDTKISNVLFDNDNNGICAIDLDTLMPGYFISDTGDMLRTYLSPAGEETPNLSEVYIREDFFEAIYKGYMSEMKEVLSPAEKQFFLFSGEMMMYMQAIRFLADFLNNDVYYGTSYPGQNLVRAKNQLHLLKEYIAAAPRLQELMNH